MQSNGITSKKACQRDGSIANIQSRNAKLEDKIPGKVKLIETRRQPSLNELQSKDCTVVEVQPAVISKMVAEFANII